MNNKLFIELLRPVAGARVYAKTVSATGEMMVTHIVGFVLLLRSIWIREDVMGLVGFSKMWCQIGQILSRIILFS